MTFKVAEEFECEKVNELYKADHTAADAQSKDTTKCGCKRNQKCREEIKAI
jgi:hypothetical protein